MRKFNTGIRCSISYLLTAVFSLLLSYPVLANTELGLSDAHNTNSKFDFSYGHISTYREDCADESCAEISAYDSNSSRVFTTNAAENELRILSINEQGQLSEQSAIDLSLYGGGPNSVAVSAGKVAVAIEATIKTDNGKVVIFDTDGKEQTVVAVGALPDMVTFTPDGRYLLVANEGEPNDDYSVDPEGSISIINTADWSVQTADFTAFNTERMRKVRIFGPGASVAQDLEPEYIAVSANSRKAWVSLQENNAIAIIDIHSAKVTAIKGLGYKKHSRWRNQFDASDMDAGPDCEFEVNDEGMEACISIKNWPVRGMYQPDAIDNIKIRGREYIVSANEGDSRDYDGFSEEVRVGDADYILDADRFPDAHALTENAALGRLKTTLVNGDKDGDGDYDRIYAYGGRSFSIWNKRGKLVFDSGSQFEDRLAALQKKGFDVWVDDRSDNKGPEPESIIVGELAGVAVVFIGLEESSGIFAYAISNPYRPRYLGYINLKQFDDDSPEGLVFIPRSRSTGWLLVTNEVSNTVSSYEVSLTRKYNRRRR